MLGRRFAILLDSGAGNPARVIFMNAEVAAFLDSLEASIPPLADVPLLLAVWHGLRGEWEAAHRIAQDDASTEGAWVHAWLHRIEGDLANARYWYGLARRDAGEGDLREEGETIAAFLLKRDQPRRT
jgi:hypothetical protein